MAYFLYPPEPAQPQPVGPPTEDRPRVRPGTVDAVIAIQIISIALLALAALGSFLARHQTARAAAATMLNRHDMPSMMRETVEWIVATSFAQQGIIYLGFAAFHLVLAILNWRGLQTSRILTWVLVGVLGLGCGVAGLVPTGIRRYTAWNRGTNLNREFRQAVAEATPPWMRWTELVATIVIVVGSIWIAYLLTRPSANAFFSKPRRRVLVPGAPYVLHPAFQPYYPHDRPRQGTAQPSAEPARPDVEPPPPDAPTREPERSD